MSAKFEINLAKNGQPYFNLKAGNGEVILSSEQYATKAAAQGGIDSVKANVADDTKFERKAAKDGSPFFVLKAANGQTIGKSEMYSAATAMENGIASVKKNAPAATVVDLTEAK